MTHNTYYKEQAEIEIRTMSEKAQKGYANTDPLTVYYDKDTGLFDLVDCDGTKTGLTREQLEAELEFWAIDED